MTSCPSSVRVAIERDINPLFSFVWECHEETRHASKSETKIRATITQAATHRRNPVFGLIRGARDIEAAVGLQFSPWWWSDEPVLMSFFWHVHPDHRRTDHAADLAAFSRWFAAQIGMPLVLVDWSGEETGKTRLFARNGHRAGSMFMAGTA